MKATEYRLRDDAMMVRDPMPWRHRSHRSAVGNARPEARVGTPAIAMRHPLPQDGSEVRLVQGNHPVQALASMVPITRSQNAFACGARTGVLRIVRPIAVIV